MTRPSEIGFPVSDGLFAACLEGCGGVVSGNSPMQAIPIVQAQDAQESNNGHAGCGNQITRVAEV